GPLSDKPGDWQPLVYCWRGGQRSGSFATILRQIGWRVAVMEGGYKSYRRLVQAQLYDLPFPAPILLLDGGTGTAKTGILARVAGLGAQVLDLEALAGHRGSLFGADAVQPSQKLFETRLAQAVVALDPARPVLIEAESNRIGTLRLPPSLWQAMRSAPHVEIMAPIEARVSHILRDYRSFCDDPARLAETLEKLRPYQSKEHLSAWHLAAQEERFAELVADLILQHYDPRYRRAQRCAAPLEQIALADLSEMSQDLAARWLIDLMQCRDSASSSETRITSR
ncbi:MAG: tRNA 2-selenouridine(34) synthase MnmH, partial [Natronohydrobacter sp.]|nr:tRNA 2-selenouridine(34) synthase MnmH [Natronohydrobacter sp.]